jgi:hypothetical protein
MIFLNGKFEGGNMRKIKTLFAVCVLSLFCSFAYGEIISFTGTWEYDSSSDPETITFTQYDESLDFTEGDSVIDMDLEMTIIYFNRLQIVVIDSDDYEHPTGYGTAYTFSRDIGIVDDITGIWKTSVEGVGDMTLTLSSEDSTNTYRLSVEVEDVNPGEPDPENPDEEDDSASDLCFIGTLR